MTEKLQIYKCMVCGNIVEVLHSGVGELVCCDEPMKLMEENTVDAAREKHVPVLENEKNQVVVKVGSDPHPMEEKHYIEWIEVIAGEKVHREFLNPGDAPEVFFKGMENETGITAREYCNVHGLWKL